MPTIHPVALQPRTLTIAVTHSAVGPSMHFKGRTRFLLLELAQHKDGKHLAKGLSYLSQMWRYALTQDGTGVVVSE
jgi:hypothetical protein